MREPTEVIADCLAVVNMAKALEQGRELPKRSADRDLWTQIQFLLRGNGADYLFRWMPSHLDEQTHEENRRKALSEHMVDEHDIDANSGANRLAKMGANANETNAQ